MSAMSAPQCGFTGAVGFFDCAISFEFAPLRMTALPYRPWHDIVGLRGLLVCSSA
jgi:hypothetical protein